MLMGGCLVRINLQSIETYIRGTSQHPLVVVGESGSGKTSIMAMAAKECMGYS